MTAEMGPDDIWRCARLVGTHSEDCPRMSAAEARVWKATEAAALKAQNEPTLPTRRILNSCLAEEQVSTECSEPLDSTNNSVAEETEETSLANNSPFHLDIHQVVPGKTLRKGGLDDNAKSNLTRRLRRIRRIERLKRGAKAMDSCAFKDFLLTPEMTTFEHRGEVFTTLHFDSGPCDPLPKTSHPHGKLVAMARKQNRTLVFKHPYAEDILSRATVISLDGTFSIIPRAFHQTVFVLVELNSLIGAESEVEYAPRWVTVAVALLSGQQTKDYQLLFTQLVALAPSLPANLTTVYCAVLSRLCLCRRRILTTIGWPFSARSTGTKTPSASSPPAGTHSSSLLPHLPFPFPKPRAPLLPPNNIPSFSRYFGRTFLGILPAPYPQKGAGGVCKALYPVRFWNVHYRILNDQPLTNCTAQVKNQSFKKMMGGAAAPSFARWLESVLMQFTSDSLSISSFPPVSNLLFPSPPSSEVTQPAKDPQLAALRSLPGFNTDSLAYQLPTNASDISSDDDDDSKLRPSTPSSEEGSDVDSLESGKETEPSSLPGPSSAYLTSTKNGPKKAPNKTGSKGRTWRFYTRQQELLKPVIVREENQTLFTHLEAIASILDSPVPEY